MGISRWCVGCIESFETFLTRLFANAREFWSQIKPGALRVWVGAPVHRAFEAHFPAH